MQVLMVFEVACTPDVAWRALHSPAVVADLYGPLLQLKADAELPEQWRSGEEAAVGMSVLGVVPMGRQTIRITDREVDLDGTTVRVMRDSGRPLSGPLSLLSLWDHQMAVGPVAGSPERALWRDRLTIGGALAPALYPGLWATWQWRRSRIIAMAPTWT